MRNYKKFSKQDYNKHDNPAKLTAKAFLEGKGYKVRVDDSDQYTYDLEMFYKGSWQPVEVEHKCVWKTKRFQYNDIQVPYRKNRHKNTSKVYILFNNDYDALCMAKMKDIHTSPMRIINTKYTQNEKFFFVDKKKFLFYELKNKEWSLQQ